MIDLEGEHGQTMQRDATAERNFLEGYTPGPQLRYPSASRTRVIAIAHLCFLARSFLM